MSHTRVRILGPIVVVGPLGERSPQGTLPKAFLAALASDAPRPVSIDRLTAMLWGDAAPAGVKVALQQLASRVRRTLEAAGTANALRHVSPGYQLVIDEGAVDLRVFRSLVRGATLQRRSGDHAGAVAALDEALDQWTGDALAELGSLPIHAMLSPLLEAERSRAESERAEALLELNRHAEAAVHLAAATARSPLDDRLWVLHGTALMNDGRTAEAARVVQAGIAVITATLGVPPSPTLVELDQTLRRRRSVDPRGQRETETAAKNPQVMPPPLHDALRTALERAETAARAAVERRAHDEAVREWQRALELLESIDPSDDRTRLRLLLGLGDTHNRVSLDTDARQAFAAAAESARRLGDTDGIAEAALGYCADRIGFAPPAEQAAMLSDALASLHPTRHRLRSRLLARLATELYWQGSPDRTFELAQAAVAAARHVNDPETHLWAQYALAFGCWTPARTPELRVTCANYLAMALDTGDRFHEMMARRWLAQAAAELGDTITGVEEAEAAVALADDLDNAAQRWMNRAIACTQQMLVGDLDRAEALATEALTIGSVVEPQTSLDYVSMLVWNIHWLRGALPSIEPLIDAVTSHDGVLAARRLGLAMSLCELGRHDEAATILESLGRAELEAIPHDASWYFAMAALAEASAATGAVALAEFALQQLLPYRRRIAINSLTTTGPVAHQAALAAACVGQRSLAIDLASEAVAVAEAAGAGLFGDRSRRLLASLNDDVS